MPGDYPRHSNRKTAAQISAFVWHRLCTHPGQYLCSFVGSLRLCFGLCMASRFVAPRCHGWSTGSVRWGERILSRCAHSNVEPMQESCWDRARVVGLGAAVRGGGQRGAALPLPLGAARSRAVISVCRSAAVCVRLSIADAAACASRILDAQHGLWSADGCPGAFADNSANERVRKCATQLWRQISPPPRRRTCFCLTGGHSRRAFFTPNATFQAAIRARG